MTNDPTNPHHHDYGPLDPVSPADHLCQVCNAPGARYYCPDCGSRQEPHVSTH